MTSMLADNHRFLGGVGGVCDRHPKNQTGPN